LGKVEGLSDFGISWITYSKEFQTLVIAYTNTNIDLLQKGKIVNISDIKRKPILGNKTINKAMFIGQNCYLACGFGIVVLDVQRNEIRDTWYIGSEGENVDVLDLAYDGTTIYAATDRGIFSAPFDHPNLANFEAWTHDTSLPHPEARYNALAIFHGRLLANNSNTVYNTDTLFMRTLPTGSWSKVPNGNTYGKNGLKVFDGILYEVNNGDVTLYDSSFNSLGKIYQYIQPDSVILPFPQDVMMDVRGYLWIGDQRSGLVRTRNFWESFIVRPDGPSRNLVFEMSASNNSLWVAPGGRNLQWANIYYEGSLYTFRDERWTSLDATNSSIFDGVRDVLTVLVDPSDREHVWAGSWGSGLFEFRNGELVARYDGTNSSLQAPPTLNPSEVRVGGLAYDQDHNLWVATSSANDLLCVRKNNGEWQSIYLGNLSFGASQTEAGKIVIDNIGQKWVIMRGSKILVYNDNNTIGQTSDDRAVILGTGVGQGNLKGSRVFSMARDRDGEIWVGSDEGVVVFYTPESVFSGYAFDAQQVLVEVGGYAQYLLEEETVTAIAVDGANRKWFGTDRAGVFLMSPDGTEQIHHFTSENSPLLSNSITDITINHNTGEVFFGTALGIISYKADATGGGLTNENVYAYPNPVRPGYEGPIAIKGLVTDADVKITDIAGNLVYSTRAEGGQAVWHGRNFQGERAKSGVYLVFISNDDGSETMVTKVAFIQ
ncbi:MAG: hypothetical protein IH599_01595, partial [Bacteroidales bacterium]|nr:hypothetical protein [Bacteroidales bacterium]